MIADQHADWLLVEQDESWFHRFMQPHAYSWSSTAQPLKLITRHYSSKIPDKAISCLVFRQNPSVETKKPPEAELLNSAGGQRKATNLA